MSKTGELVLAMSEAGKDPADITIDDVLADKANTRDSETHDKDTSTDDIKLVQLGATIAVSNYSNIQPVIQAPTTEDGLKFLANLAHQVGNDDYAKQVGAKPTSEVKLTEMTDISGLKVYLDQATHTYSSDDGKSWMSGSRFASLSQRPFNYELIAKKVARDGLSAEQVLNLWQAKNNIACDFGLAVHKTMEMFTRYYNYASILSKSDDEDDESWETVLPHNPYLKDVAMNFFTEERRKEIARPEVFVADKELHLCGSIDRMVFKDVDTRTVEVFDYKTNSLSKKVSFKPEWKEAFPELPNTKYGEYMLQLSFYAYILERKGYNVKRCVAVELNDNQWKEYEFKPLDVQPGLKLLGIL